MRLVGIAKVQRQLRAVKPLAGVETLDEFVQPITADHPLRRNTDVLLEEPLQRTDANTFTRSQFLNREDRWISTRMASTNSALSIEDALAFGRRSVKNALLASDISSAASIRRTEDASFRIGRPNISCADTTRSVRA